MNSTIPKHPVNANLDTAQGFPWSCQGLEIQAGARTVAELNPREDLVGLIRQRRAGVKNDVAVLDLVREQHLRVNEEGEVKPRHQGRQEEPAPEQACEGG